MKNSTLLLLICLSIVIGALCYKFTSIIITFLPFFVIIFGVYYIISTLTDEILNVNYRHRIIPVKYNIFSYIGKFFRWLDTKPYIIKHLKKDSRTPDDWRATEDWDSEIK